MPELKSRYVMEVADDPARVVGGLWSLSYDGLILVDAAWSGKPVILVPTEDVRLLAVDLPIANRTQRLAALPFVIEDAVAEPLEALHTALGEALSPGRYLAGVVRHQRMVQWCEMATHAGLGEAQMVPDALALPVPAPETWAVARIGGRVLVRTDVGNAFAVTRDAFEAVWINAGRPELRSHGEPLRLDPPPAITVEALSVWPALSRPPALDLRQGLYAAQSRSAPWLRRAAMVVAIGILAHAALWSLDTVALMKSAAHKRAVVTTLVTGAGGAAGGDLATTAQAMLPSAGATPSGLLPLFGRAARALQPLGTSVSLLSIDYGTDAGLTMALEAADLAGLQSAEAALSGAGLTFINAGASVEGGRAHEKVTITRGGST